MIVGNIIGVTPVTPKTFMLMTEDGHDIPAVYVESETIFTATENDIREGKVAATSEGVTIGEKVIPAYHTHQGYRLIMPGKEFVHSGEDADYTKMQAIICAFNTSASDSVAAEKVSIDNVVYNVQSTEPLSNVAYDGTNNNINFGITNDTEERKVLRYFYYKEIE